MESYGEMCRGTYVWLFNVCNTKEKKKASHLTIPLKGISGIKWLKIKYLKDGIS